MLFLMRLCAFCSVLKKKTVLSWATIWLFKKGVIREKRNAYNRSQLC